MGKAHLIQSNLLRRIRATEPHDIIMGLCCFYRCKNNQSFNICYRYRPGRVRRKYGASPAINLPCNMTQQYRRMQIYRPDISAVFRR